MDLVWKGPSTLWHRLWTRREDYIVGTWNYAEVQPAYYWHWQRHAGAVSVAYSHDIRLGARSRSRRSIQKKMLPTAKYNQNAAKIAVIYLNLSALRGWGVACCSLSFETIAETGTGKH